jgi:hypothetical protein
MPVHLELEQSEHAPARADNGKRKRYSSHTNTKPDTRADRAKDGSRAGDIHWQWTEPEFIKVCIAELS